MKRLWLKLRLCLGGAVWGGLSGIALGAVFGAIVGLLNDDISLGLDGALIGGGLGILAGAFYGVVVATADSDAGPDTILIVGPAAEQPASHPECEPMPTRTTREPTPLP